MLDNADLVPDGLSLNNDAHQVSVKQATVAQIKGPAFAIWGRQPSRLEITQSLIHDAQDAFHADAGTIDGEFNACSRTRNRTLPRSMF